MIRSIIEVEVERDLDVDRYIEYEDFCELVRKLPELSRKQCFYLILGMTGFRPIEVCRLSTSNFDFTEAERPVLVNRITKSKKKTYYDERGRVIATKIIKVKRRVIPEWVRDYLLEYVNHWRVTLKPDDKGGAYLFSSRVDGKSFITVNTWCADLAKLRDKLVREDPKWSWVKQPCSWKVIRGKPSPVYRLSLYSFRKARATWHGMELMSKGISDVLLNVSHFMGHQRINTTYTYLKALVSETRCGTLEPIKPPNLNKPIFTREGFTQDRTQALARQLARDPAFLKIVEEYLDKND